MSSCSSAGRSRSDRWDIWLPSKMERMCQLSPTHLSAGTGYLMFRLIASVHRIQGRRRRLICHLKLKTKSFITSLTWKASLRTRKCLTNQLVLAESSEACWEKPEQIKLKLETNKMRECNSSAIFWPTPMFFLFALIYSSSLFAFRCLRTRSRFGLCFRVRIKCLLIDFNWLSSRHIYIRRRSAESQKKNHL